MSFLCIFAFHTHLCHTKKLVKAFLGQVRKRRSMPKVSPSEARDELVSTGALGLVAQRASDTAGLQQTQQTDRHPGTWFQICKTQENAQESHRFCCCLQND